MQLPSNRTTSDTVLFVTCALILTALMSAAPARGQLQLGKIGVSGGANLERIKNLRSSDVTASFDRATGYHLGVSYDQPLGPIYLRPGFIVRRAGTFTFPSSFEGPGHTLLEGRSFNVWVFEIPVDVRYQYDFGEVAGIYAFAGPTLSLPRAEQDFDEGFPNATFAADGGLGVEIAIPNFPLVVAPELRYSYSVTNTIKKDFQLRGRTFETEGLNSNGPSARLHVYVPLDF